MSTHSTKNVYSRPKHDEGRAASLEVEDRVDSLQLLRVSPNPAVIELELGVRCSKWSVETLKSGDGEEDSLRRGDPCDQGLVLAAERGPVELEAYIPTRACGIKGQMEVDADPLVLDLVYHALVRLTIPKRLDKDGVAYNGVSAMFKLPVTGEKPAYQS